MADTAPRHTVPVTGTPDPVAAEKAAHAALLAHRASCPSRSARARCGDCARLTAEWRRALRECGQAAATAGDRQ